MSAKNPKTEIIFRAQVSCINPDTLEKEPVGAIAVTSMMTPFFIPTKDAKHDPARIRRTFFRNWERYATEKAASMDTNLSGLMGGFPLPGTMLDKKFAHIIGPNYGDKNTVQRFMAVIRARGVFSKNGLVIEHKPVPNERSIRNANITARIARAYADHMTPEASNTGVAHKEMDALMSLRSMIRTNAEVAPGGNLVGDDNYADLIIDKSEGGQNIVITDPDDPAKKVKIITDDFASELTETEVLANRLTHAAGFSAPNAEIIRSGDDRGLAIRMDDYKMVGGVIEGRQEYLLDFLGKSMDQVHQMSYQEISIGLDDYERRLPPGLRDSQRLLENKKAVFKWALLNSVTNNTDNHGRNLALLSDSEGRIKIAPFIDVTFDSAKRPMSTCLDGDPPIHSIDISRDDQVAELWNEVLPEEDVAAAFEIRDDLAAAVEQLPQLAQDLGIDLNGPVMDRVLNAVNVQSFSTASTLQQSLDEARLAQLRQEQSNTMEAPSI